MPDLNLSIGHSNHTVDQEQLFRNIFRRLLLDGKRFSPRGLEIIELENFMVVFPPYVRFMNFSSRKLNLRYIKKEFLWYLRADKYDTSITEHAVIWKDLVNPDGIINSNYGQYIFSKEMPQFYNVAGTLLSDVDSRRAVMMILQAKHLLSTDVDIPCTFSISFRIRDNKLNMTVHMRSQDAVYGLGNDLPIFSFIHEMMYVYLKDIKYGGLQIGNYVHLVDSFHVYKKHYGMLRSIATNHSDIFTAVECPEIQSRLEVTNLTRFIGPSESNHFPFTAWLYS